MLLTYQEIEQLEEKFRQNRYDGDLKNPNYFEYKEGRIPVLVSAPHATNHLSTKTGETKAADIYTGTLALLLHKWTHAHVIHLTKQDRKNPNGEPESAYKDAISSLHSKHGFRLVIDLHAAASRRPFDIDLGTSQGQSISIESMQEIRGIFYKYGIVNVTENHTFSAPFPTITNFVHTSLGVPAVQVEINRRLRSPSERLLDFQLLTEALSETILRFA